MSILVEIVDSRLENTDETSSFRKQCNYANMLVHKYERCLSKGRVLQIFSPFLFYRKSTKCEEKLIGIFSFFAE